MNESGAGADFSRYILDRMRQLEERNLALREQKDRVEGEKRLIENQKLKFEREARKLRSELERLRVGPMIVGTIVDVLDENRVIVKSSTGPRFVVSLSQFIEEEIKVGAQVGLNQQSFAVMCVLPSPRDPAVFGMEIEEAPDVQFSQIGGLDTQISEIREIVELPLKRPDLFTSVGIEPPKGVLLHGPPGTGKTILAKAVAQSTEATFMRVVGSEFVQKYIGEGARLVRELFELAKSKSPAIIFIDELDAIGARRMDGATSGDREVQRTLMQILAEMDGFDARGEVKLIAATNRLDMLDPALLRPGRFDRVIEIPLPSKEARESILKIHTKGMNLDRDVNLRLIAELSEGSSGADLKALSTEAGMYAIREERTTVYQSDFERAAAKILLKERNHMAEPEGLIQQYI
ncbi:MULTISPECIES: proteasome-activating nucleotidase [Methanothrix]|jgi:26S proteasome subunit P45 family|nr:MULTISPECIES: proteasome-activating nucleotidase [Methanothrix]MBP7067261.1 proteasome-activating nucleotidase [Methanothrix sp.]MDY0412290.1 proteasome-activating nucleotidase [Methanothrix soehngenii]NLJ23148.1 proteasome-activating nucleotidase [Methanothrix soehngenii]HNQ52599.1 proteasome-activating nucleotidase [Methanothrix soehngenii]HNT46490.1 proteasome-activating nucleotidase [Methanothrix soehngenii]